MGKGGGNVEGTASEDFDRGKGKVAERDREGWHELFLTNLFS